MALIGATNIVVKIGTSDFEEERPLTEKKLHKISAYNLFLHILFVFLQKYAEIN